MKKLLDFIHSAISQFVGFAQILLAIAALLYCTHVIIEPMWPIFTGAFILFGTAAAWFNNWKTMAMSIIGSGLYALSWPTVDWLGLYVALAVWGIGFLLWFYAGVKGFFSQTFLSRC